MWLLILGKYVLIQVDLFYMSESWFTSEINSNTENRSKPDAKGFFYKLQLNTKMII